MHARACLLYIAPVWRSGTTCGNPFICFLHLPHGYWGSHSGCESLKHELLLPAEPFASSLFKGNSISLNFSVLQIKKQNPREMEGLVQCAQSRSHSWVLTPKAEHFPVSPPEVWFYQFLIFNFYFFQIAERTHAEWNLMRTSGITYRDSFMFYKWDSRAGEWRGEGYFHKTNIKHSSLETEKNDPICRK